jgi:hypothetical protein
MSEFMVGVAFVSFLLALLGVVGIGPVNLMVVPASETVCFAFWSTWTYIVVSLFSSVIVFCEGVKRVWCFHVEISTRLI